MSTQTREPSASQPGKHDNFIAAQLAQAEKRIRLIDLTTALAGAVAGTLAYGIVVMLLDRAFLLSGGTRQILLLVYLAAAGVYCYLAFLRPLRWKVNPHYAARRLEETTNGNRNHVINWIDLKGEKVPGVLRSELGTRAARDLAHADVEQAISGQRALLMGGAASVCAIVLIVLFVLFGPGPFRSLLARAFSPFGRAAGIATRTQVRIVRPEQGHATVTIGNPITIVAEVAGRIPDTHDKDAPSLLYRHDENEPYRRRFLQRDELGNEWMATVTPLDVGNGFFYKVTAGDAETPEYRVTVRATPLIGDFLATYQYRPYVGRATKSRTMRKLEDLRGTEVRLLARTNRVLRNARFEFEGADGVRDHLDTELLADDPQAMRFRLTLDRAGKYRIRFTSQEGETYLDPTAHEVVVLPDLAPEVRLTSPAKDVSIPLNGHVNLTGEATDDIGVARVSLRMQVVGGPALAPKHYLAGKLGTPELGTPRKLEYRDLLIPLETLDEAGKPAALKAGMQLEYWLEAADACDYAKPNVTASQPRYKVTLADPTPDAEKKKQQARDQQRQDQKQQEQQLKNEKGERDRQQKEEEAANEQEQKGKADKGKGGEPKSKESGGKGENSDPQKGKEGDPGKDPQPNEGNAKPEDPKKDDETRDQADKLAKALEQQGKGQGDDRKQEDKPGIGKDEGMKGQDEKPGEKKEEGEKGGDGQKGEKGEKGEGKDGGKADATEGKGQGEGKPGGDPRAGEQPPGEGKSGEGKGKPTGAKTGQKPPENGPKPGDEVRQGEGKGEGTPAGERPGEPKDGAKPDADSRSPDAKPAEAKPAEARPGEKGRTGEGDKPEARKPSENKPGKDKGEGKAEKGDPRDAKTEDVQARAKDLGSKEPGKREQARRDLNEIGEKANDEAVRDAAKKALEEAGKDDPMNGAQAPGKPGAEAKKPEAGEKGMGETGGKDGMGQTKAGEAAGEPRGQAKDSGTANRPGEGLEGDRQAGGGQDGGTGQPALKEKAGPHRASMLQLEDFKKKVSKEVLRDAKMSQEQYEKFLRDYAELAKRQTNPGGDQDTPPPAGRTGTLPSLGGKALQRPGAKGEETRNEGRPKPPPEYRDAHKSFLERVGK